MREGTLLLPAELLFRLVIPLGPPAIPQRGCVKLAYNIARALRAQPVRAKLAGGRFIYARAGDGFSFIAVCHRHHHHHRGYY